jgi:hypothetical protein
MEAKRLLRELGLNSYDVSAIKKGEDGNTVAEDD